MGKRKSVDGEVDVNGIREALLHEVMHKILGQDMRGSLGPAMTKEAMVEKHTVNGVLLARPLPRSGIHQDFKVNDAVERVMKTLAERA